jgi:hypothetical protein
MTMSDQDILDFHPESLTDIEFERKRLALEVIKLREAIRYAGRQARDEKCFLDFFRLFDLLPEGRSAFITDILDKKSMLSNCEIFYDNMKEYLKTLKEGEAINTIYCEWKKRCPYARY